MRGWVLRIAHNEAVSALRKVRDEAWAPDQLPEAESTDATADPDQLATLLGDAAEIKVVLDALDPLTRSILILREAEGLSYDEIAETVGGLVGGGMDIGALVQEQITAVSYTHLTLPTNREV